MPSAAVYHRKQIVFDFIACIPTIIIYYYTRIYTVEMSFAHIISYYTHAIILLLLLYYHILIYERRRRGVYMRIITIRAFIWPQNAETRSILLGHTAAAERVRLLYRVYIHTRRALKIIEIYV